jgi:diguanylate cyclase (GGDEF)-like protein/PAS domain S-box-containing protein
MIEHIFQEYFSEYKDISRIMNRAVFTMAPGTSLDKVVAEMVARTVSCVVIARDGRPLGILTERDVARFVARGGDVTSRVVDEIMCSPVTTAPMDVPVYESTRIMRTLGIRRLVIVDGRGEIAGLLTQTDIIKGIEDKYIQILKDVIREKDAELEQSYKELREKTLYLDCILTSSIDLGIVAVDGRNTVILYNPAARAILGQDEDQVLGRSIQEVHRRLGVDPGRFAKAAAGIGPGTRHNFVFELGGSGGARLIQANMSGIWREGCVQVGYVLMLRDITEQRKAEEAVAFLAYHDSLTGLANRTLLGERLSHELTRAERYGTNLAILMVDIDRFKSTNDLLGHVAGDTVLRAVAGRMTEIVRRSDTVARIGGDEFMLVLPEVGGMEEAAMIAGKVRDQVAREVEIEGKMVPVSLSIGISMYPANGTSAKALVKAADDAMYRAKEMNRINFRSNVAVSPESRN